MTKKMKKDEFVKKARLVHGDKFIYDKTNLNNRDSKGRVIITCPIHGDFLQTPGSHLAGRGCNLCSKPVYDTESFINEAKKVHKNKYDYSKVKYVDSHTKVCIICQKHGEFFVSPNNHLRGKGCKQCAIEKNASKCRLTLEEFIEKAKRVHGDKYDYSNVEYTNNSTNVKIMCPIHGIFEQSPGHHLDGEGCPVCKESKLEKNVRENLEKNGIEYIKEYSPKWAGKFRYDFFIPSKNIIVECQGYHHYHPVYYSTEENGLKNFIKRVKDDLKKKELCEQNGLTMIYFTNDNLKKRDEITNIDNLIELITL